MNEATATVISSRTMAEAEVTLRFAFWLLNSEEPESHADLAIDGAHVRIKSHRQLGRYVEERTVFLIEDFLAASGCSPVAPKDEWRGKRFTRNGRTFSIQSMQGFDVRVSSGTRLVLAECKGGPLETIKGKSASLILAGAIGQVITSDSPYNAELWVAVPDSPAFRKTAHAIRRKPTFRATGIRIALVSESGVLVVD
jgi:hypothetical protein